MWLCYTSKNINYFFIYKIIEQEGGTNLAWRGIGTREKVGVCVCKYVNEKTAENNS
jgi:hypothetical protein